MFKLEREFEKTVGILPNFGFSLNIKNEIEKCIWSIFSSFKETDKIIIRGGGFHTEKLLKVIRKKYSKNILNIVSIIDDDMRGEEIDGIPIISKLQEENIKYDIVIISSFSYAKEMCYDYDESKVKIWNLYDEFNKQGYNLTAPFYYYIEGNYEIPLYYKNIYKLDKTKENLEMLIDSLLVLKDFKTSFYYIEEYINSGFDLYGIYEELKQSLFKMFNIIKKTLEYRKRQDIIMFWIDAVPYEKLSWLPFVYSKKDHTCFFKNAYTTTPYTHPTMHALFQGALRLENYSITQEEIDETNSEVIQDIQEANYSFFYAGYAGNKHISAKYRGENSSIEVNMIRMVSACKVYWEVMCCLLNSKNPVYCIAHSVAETHEPYMSLFLENNRSYKTSEVLEQKQNKKSYSYLNEQLEFYSNLLPDDMIKIYMSDHGNLLKLDTWQFREQRIHPFFLVEGKNIQANIINDIFSYINFKYIIKYILYEDERYLKKAISEYSVIEDVDRYSLKYINSLLHSGNIEHGMAYRGVVTNSDKYIRLANGKEFYFILPDESKNLIDYSRFSDRIAELSKIAGDYFLDLDDYPEFEHSKKLYIDKRQSNRKEKEDKNGWKE